MNAILQLCKLAGMFVAVIIGIGYATTFDFDQVLNAPVADYAEEASLAAHAASSSHLALPAAAQEERVVRIRPEAAASQQREIAMDRRPAPADRAAEPKRKTRRAASARAIEDWIQINISPTYLEAEQATISPGVILATGVYFLQEGQGDVSMTATDVAAYLATVRQAASAEAKAHMKYIANSEEWFKGLQMAGFDGQQLSRIFRAHKLKAFDRQMYSRHVERKVEHTEEYAIADKALAADVNTRDNELAGAYNDYADRSEVREKYGLPQLETAKMINTREVSAGRLAAESFELGESRTYKTPREFWAVLQEIIALEHDYDSWEAYRAANRRAADKEFQIRSDIMATGGVMKVTRRKGA